MTVKLNEKHLENFINADELSAMQPFVETAHSLLHNKTGQGSDFLGWVDLPERIDPKELNHIKATAKRIRSICDVFLVIGIGGSYLGARAALEFLGTSFYNQNKDDETPEIYFVGNSISPDYLNQIIKSCEGKDVCINVISKSGTTLEPALAFRIFREMLVDKYGEKDAAERIFCTTDGAKGALKGIADEQGYETFVIPDDVGGRFSVLTPVGLLPIAVGGFDIDALVEGGLKAQKAYETTDICNNPCYKYAAIRNILYNKGMAIEVLVSYEPALALLGEWYKQLFGESEGKDHKGLYPASMIFSTDLHSLGQFVQDGSRILFETIVDIENSNWDISVKEQEGDFDGLNFLAGKTMSEINRKAMEGTLIAHVDGGATNIILSVPDRSEDSLGQLFYFFEKACGISGYMLGVNPFNQPGVEDYKRNMFALLNRPGYEDILKELQAKNI